MRIKISKVFKESGLLVLFIGFCQMMYSWGYLQSAVDYGVADFSAPPSIVILGLVPWLVGAIISFVISFILYKKGK